jgi:hypothetical protein
MMHRVNPSLNRATDAGQGKRRRTRTALLTVPDHQTVPVDLSQSTANEARDRARV